MHTNTRPVRTTPTATTAAHRRRRHLSVYHRALRSAETPEQRAAVASRYRQLFTTSAHPSALAAVTQLADNGLDRVAAVTANQVSGTSTGSVENQTVTVAA